MVDAEQAKLAKEGSKQEAKTSKAEPKKKMPKWKMQSAQFRAAMQATKGDDDAGPTVVGTTKGLKEDGYNDERDYYVKCKFCGRSFNEEAAKKHIPSCENKAKLAQFKNPPKGKKPNGAGGRKY